MNFEVRNKKVVFLGELTQLIEQGKVRSSDSDNRSFCKGLLGDFKGNKNLA